jgi:hypothetical protein
MGLGAGPIGALPLTYRGYPQLPPCIPAYSSLTSVRSTTLQDNLQSIAEYSPTILAIIVEKAAKQVSAQDL